MFNIEFPINATGIGQQSYAVLVEIFKRKLLPNIFPIGQVDLSPFDVPNGFVDWLNFCISKSLKSFRNDQKTIRCWHISGSERRLTNHTSIWCPHETDALTPEEVNILSQHERVFAQSQYSKGVFESKGLKNVVYCPLFLYDWFKRSDRKFVGSKKITTFGLMGKMEKRKSTLPILGLWGQLFGNDERYRLNAIISNPFIEPERQKAMINTIFQGKPPWNINFISFQQKNSVLNDVLNTIDVDISGLSSAEGWNISPFRQIALGKQAVVLNAHAHKDYANEENAILVESSSKQPIYDGQFFYQGAPFNQGNMHVWEKEAFDSAMLRAAEVAKLDNPKGLELQKIFTADRCISTLLE